MTGILSRSRGVGIFATLFALFLCSLHLNAQVKVLRVDPAQTDPAIATVHGPHIALYDPNAPSRHRLFLFLVGTHGSAAGSQKIDSAFAGWGYHAISLDYEDNVVAVAGAHSLDPETFGLYRKTIVTGAPGSKLIEVSPANSILNRFQKLLVYLAAHDPNGGWNEFLDNGQPVWSRIIVAGHSQGSGHAAYIAKLFRVDRVLMFSGPQDYMDDLNKPAPWQARPGATPPSRFFAFLALHDPFNVHHQIANCMALMDLSQPDTLMVEPGEAIQGDHHILINNFPTKNYHGSTLFPQFENVWEYMATVNVE
ncbi:MAG: BPSS1187 family protein [Acidobacteriota bacterium]